MPRKAKESQRIPFTLLKHRQEAEEEEEEEVPEV
jgi:hypothetical protein